MSGPGGGDPAPVPLARLLVMAERQLIGELHQRLADQGWDDVGVPYGFVLLAVRDRSTTTTELADLLGVSKQAVSKLLDAMAAGGYVQRSPDPSDGRVKVVALAPRGKELLATVEVIYTDLESGWAAVIGAEQVEALRSGLTRVLLAANDGTLPAVRPT